MGRKRRKRQNKLTSLCELTIMKYGKCFFDNGKECNMSHSKILQKKDAKKKPDLWRDIKEVLESVLNVLVSIYMLLIMVVMPFYFTNGYSRIGTNKYEFFHGVSTGMGSIILPVMGVYLVVELVIYFRGKKDEGAKRSLLQRLSVTDWFALGYALVVTLSYFCSDYRKTTAYGNAWKGANGWYMGLVSQLTFVAIYFMISRFWKRHKWMLALWLPVTFVVFGLGYLNRFGIRPIEMANASPSFISTIGNINWYCGYIVTLFFGILYYFWWKTGRKGWSRLGRMLWISLGFATLLTQGSQSGILVLFVALGVLYLLSMRDAEKLQSFFACLLCMGLACTGTYLARKILEGQFNYPDAFTNLFTYSPIAVVILVAAAVLYMGIFYLRKKEKVPIRAFQVVGCVGGILIVVAVLAFLGLGIANTISPGSIVSLSENSLFTFDLKWGSSRGATWAAAVMCFQDQSLKGKLLGVGPDCMAMYIHSGVNEKLLAMVQEYFGNLALTNAHCEWLTVLVNTGLLGMICFAGMMVSAIVRFLKAGEKSAIIGACGFGVLAYTINSMLSFQQAMGAVTVFLVLGMGEAYLRKNEPCGTASGTKRGW